jgi:hypothetical protein
MEGFAIIQSASGLIRTLRAEGYTSRQRGGSPGTMTGLHVLHVTVVRGANLPPHAIVLWLGASISHTTFTHREFVSNDEIQAWIRRWNIVLGPCLSTLRP